MGVVSLPVWYTDIPDRCVVYTHSKACTNDALDEGVHLALVPAIDVTEYRQRTVYHTGGGGAYLSHTQAHTLAAQRLDGRCRYIRELCYQHRCDLKGEEDSR